MKKRILFVDDEPNILSSMRRMLRGLRKTVVMDFVENGREALDIMAAEPYDVVISDMRMPGMDGAELLTLIRDRWPCTIRIMLTGQADSDSMLRTVNVVHKFLMKPCGQDEIKECINRACVLHSFLVVDGSLQQIPDILGGKFVFPDTYQDIQEVLNHDECSVELLAQCLERDEWLASKVRQLSTVLGADGSDECLADAVRSVGYSALRPLVLSLHLFRLLLHHGSHHRGSFEKVLVHGMRVAQYAKKIAEVEQVKAGDLIEPFIGGLLHDVGYLLLAIDNPEQYTTVFEDLLQQRASFDSIESDQFSFSHNKAGGLLLVVLGFPLEIIEVVAYHTNPCLQQDRTSFGLMAVHIADALLPDEENAFCCFRSELNQTYLVETGGDDRLSKWRALL